MNRRTLTSDPILAQILKTGGTLLDHDADRARAAVETLTACAVADGSASERIASAFLRGFAARLQLGAGDAGNLYTSTCGRMDMITAFDVLVHETPLVTFGHESANHSISAAVAPNSQVHIVDLGIGSGLQWMHLFDLLAARPDGTPSVHLTGIDLPGASRPPDERLLETGTRLAAYAQRRGIPFTYTAIASRLEDVKWRTVRRSVDEALVVNAALALHHVPDSFVSQPDARDVVLRKVLTLRPAIFTLTEPDSEHNGLEFLPRLQEALRHYHTVFDALATLLPNHQPERKIIEQEFFGREIVNVVACEGNKRVERHERAEAWIHRLTRLGFTPFQQQESVRVQMNLLPMHEAFDLVPNGAGCTLCWKKTPVIASTAWVGTTG